jgi:hypothetical protein
MSELEVQVVTVHGSADPRAQAYARRKIGQLARLAPGPVRGAWVKLDRALDPALDRPAMAQATLDLNGRLVRAQVTARQVNEAVDLLQARLRHRLEHLSGRRRARRRRAGAARPGQWRHADAAGHRSVGFSRPLEERAVVRREQLARTPMSVAGLRSTWTCWATTSSCSWRRTAAGMRWYGVDRTAPSGWGWPAGGCRVWLAMRCRCGPPRRLPC